jgi:hypothetical protein
LSIFRKAVTSLHELLYNNYTEQKTPYDDWISGAIVWNEGETEILRIELVYLDDFTRENSYSKQEISYVKATFYELFKIPKKI